MHGKWQRHEAKNTARPTMVTPAAGPTTPPSPSLSLPLWPLTNAQFAPPLPWYYPQLASAFPSVPMLAAGAFAPPVAGRAAAGATSQHGAFATPEATSATAGATSQPPATGTPKKSAGAGDATGEAVDSAGGLDEIIGLGDETDEAPADVASVDATGEYSAGGFDEFIGFVDETPKN
ncbi:unnamed protein product [Ectocarpus sp. 12 AP-2014]